MPSYHVLILVQDIRHWDDARAGQPSGIENQKRSEGFARAELPSEIAARKEARRRGGLW